MLNNWLFTTFTVWPKKFWRWPASQPVPSTVLTLIITQTQIFIIGGSCHKYHFCCNKTFVYFLSNKTFVVTNTCLSRQNTSFVERKVCLLRQNFSRDKLIFVMTKYFCRNKHVFVATKVSLSWQNFCYDIIVCFDIIVCCDKNMFATTKLLSGQRLYLWQLPPMIDLPMWVRHRN